MALECGQFHRYCFLSPVISLITAGVPQQWFNDPQVPKVLPSSTLWLFGIPLRRAMGQSAVPLAGARCHRCDSSQIPYPQAVDVLCSTKAAFYSQGRGFFFITPFIYLALLGIGALETIRAFRVTHPQIGLVMGHQSKHGTWHSGNRQGDLACDPTPDPQPLNYVSSESVATLPHLACCVTPPPC